MAIPVCRYENQKSGPGGDRTLAQEPSSCFRINELIKVKVEVLINCSTLKFEFEVS